MEMNLLKATQQLLAETELELDSGVLRLEHLGPHYKNNKETRYICFT